MNPYLDHHQDKCVLERSFDSGEMGVGAFKNSIYFVMNFKSKSLMIYGRTLNMVRIFKNKEELYNASNYQNYPNNLLSNNGKYFNSRNSKAQVLVPMKIEKNISAEFLVFIPSEASQGLYNLYFHNCPNYNKKMAVKVDFKIEIEEINQNNYLSAGEMPLSGLYFMMSMIFFLCGTFWLYILMKSKHPVFKIHYLMVVLVYLKCLSLLFHGIHFHFIQRNGEHVETWAILFYIIYLLKGSVLFTVILLIGTGWTFIRRGDALSEKHKKIFMIVLPLQVLANIAKIIIDESEEGDAEQQTWWDIFILVDILCCGAIMFPVVWTIKHLQEASYTDGKAAINLRKLKLFRHFYIMIVCYFYFTRIIVYILKITVTFQYEWLDEMFRELATFVCFVITGYKFRPASANPYYQVPSDEEEIETCVIVREENLPEGLKKVNKYEHSDNVNIEETTRFLVNET
ncbi:protein GPR107 precursor, putative [Pediculus humanus corporis]|uniref:Protein GPR107, putative n=1 Tax=Pediculus humanus subsp. corporis TaxID=121224 RepID=E0W0V3_PEDHC|nr:protein GPR107 precursor, putative [Pediculus humanus corporis]EEB19259.1 protein GPR107 precursor, putative [Pediculus humanus corporis]